MKKNIQISVPNPCHEKWSSFTKTSNGGFCDSCQKEVIDFTSWSDEGIKLYFKNATGNACGRFRQDQLKVYSYSRANNTGISWISFVFTGFLLLFSSRQVSAQTTPKQTTEQYQPDKNYETAETQGRKGSLKERPVTGVVKAAKQDVPLPGVWVRLKGTSRTTTTDGEGKFSLTLPDTESSQILVFSLDGFKTVEYLHNVTRPGQEIAVDMTRHELSNIQPILSGTMGGVTVSRWYAPREIARDVWWWLTGR